MYNETANGAGYAILGFVIFLGLFMAAAWLRRVRTTDFHPTQTDLIVRLVALAGCLAAVIVVPLVAKPGSQPGWNLLVQIASMPAAIIGAIDVARTLRGRNNNTKHDQSPVQR